MAAATDESYKRLADIKSLELRLGEEKQELEAEAHPALTLLVVGGDALDHLYAVLNGGLLNDDGLEAPFQGGVLLDVPRRGQNRHRRGAGPTHL